MDVDDSRPVRAAAGGENHGENANEASTVFERGPRHAAVKNVGENLNRTSSIFEWPTRRQAAKNLGDNLKRTSSIFERPERRQVPDNRGERVSPQHGHASGDKAKHQDPFETGGNPSRERRYDDGTRFARQPQRTTVSRPQPEQDGLHAPTTPEAELIGRTLADKYTIESVIGTGSMGTIYRARQIALDKWVAVKVLHRELAEQRNFVERFKFEAFSASRLEHPNSLRVLDFGEDGNLLHLVMEYVEADDLLTVMQREWPIKDVRVVQIMSQALAALAKAHEVGIVHRDIKPENILILRGTDDEGNATEIVKVCDFGIAKMAGPAVEQSRPFAPQLTTQGLVVGTPDYMSPEQARGESVDGRSDLYSMGVVLYHLLCGRPPFIADTPFGIAIQHVSALPVPPSRHRPVNAALESICLRAMNKRPEDRFQSAREMRRAVLSSLDPYADNGTTYASSAAPPDLLVQDSTASSMPSERWFRRPNAMVAAAGVVTIATLALASLISRLRGQDSPPSEGNVVRTATVALTPAPQAKAASSEGSNPARVQPQSPTTPDLVPGDTRPTDEPSESELRARPPTGPSPGQRR